MDKPKPRAPDLPRVSLNLMYVPTETRGLKRGDVYKKEDGSLWIFQG